MAKVEQWHRGAAREHYRGINPATAHRIDTLAQLIADHEPAPLTDQELVEKYAGDLSELGGDLTDNGTVNNIRDILTRFLSEVRGDGVDVGIRDLIDACKNENWHEVRKIITEHKEW